MVDDKDDRIRRRAYEIWQRSGEGHGEHQHHWDQASAETEREDRQPGEQAGAAMPGAVIMPAGEPDPLAAEALGMSGDERGRPSMGEAMSTKRPRRPGT
ncbi:DUF2934 domain-containing protein [Mesorhizobium sp. INR15]|uniref:DUF2934 domain-containing protein n=1 Tax=Mesorhizobium sp. INR15 TaxID=2654248 RepID=UPI001896A3A3|nr:DUF2934 domain-containing protein [Mesorhizobium sp. INR15]QPC91579.1 DUF2934 domain-containing protein [Mesorhizobium sp. INR15]